jgi:hypothetical protein
MRCMARIEIHDKEYGLLHERIEAVSFSRTTVDSSTGKNVHLPTGTYVTDTYANAKAALLAATGAALQVDPLAEIVVSGGDQILTYGCSEVGETFWDNILGSTIPK